MRVVYGEATRMTLVTRPSFVRAFPGASLMLLLAAPLWLAVELAGLLAYLLLRALTPRRRRRALVGIRPATAWTLSRSTSNV